MNRPLLNPFPASLPIHDRLSFRNRPVAPRVSDSRIRDKVWRVRVRFARIVQRPGSLYRFLRPGWALLVSACTPGKPLPDDARLSRDISHTGRATGPLTGRLFLRAKPGPSPAVLLLHGGGWRNGSPHQMDVIARRLVGDGFPAFSAEYRFAPGIRYPGAV